MKDKPFYGWIIVAASFVILTTAYGMQFSYGIYVPYFESELGLDRASASAPLSVYIVVYSLLSVISGRLTDQIGPRTVVMLGGVLITIGYVLLSQATSSWQTYVFLGVVSGIGMSATFIPLNATVVRWFFRKRGTALAITGTGTNLGAILGPLTATLLIPHFGWRSSMLIIALVAGCVITMCATFLVRDPESLHLEPDGLEPKELSGAYADTELVTQWTRDEAITTRAFWVILAIFLMSWAILFFPYAHLPSLARDYGYSKTFGASLIGVMGIGGFLGRLVIGTLSDRLGRRGSLCIALVMQAIACVMFALLNSSVSLSFAAALFGAGAGSAITLFPAIVGDNFGRTHVGAIAGLIFAIASAVSALGPYLAGLMRDVNGDYVNAFIVGAILNLGALIFVGLLKTPR